MSDLSWLNPTPHTIAVYASSPLSPAATQHSLPSGRYPLLGPDFHRLDRTSLRLAHALDDLTLDEPFRKRARAVGAGSVSHEELAIQIENRKHETRFVDLERVAGRNLCGAAQINADSSGHARVPRRRPAAGFTLPCRRRPNSRSPRPPTGDRRAALLVITVDLYLIPHAVYAIRIGTCKGVHGGAVLGVNHEYAAHGSLAVISNECARSHNVDIVVDGVIEMNAVGAIEFGPCGQHVRLVDGVNDEEHSRSLPDGS